MRLTADDIRCLHRWKIVFVADAVFHRRGEELVCTSRIEDPPAARVLVEHDQDYHREEDRKLEELWVLP